MAYNYLHWAEFDKWINMQAQIYLSFIQLRDAPYFRNMHIQRIKINVNVHIGIISFQQWLILTLLRGISVCDLVANPGYLNPVNANINIYY